MVSGNGTILSSPFFVEGILPFLLIFTVVFAILQKAKILGDGKKQIDAIVAAVIGLIVISFGYATNTIVNLVPFLAVSVVVILVFMILYGMVFQEGDFKMNKYLKGTFGVIIAIAVIIAVALTTGLWDYIRSNWFGSVEGSSIWANVVFIIIIIAAVVAVLIGKGENSGNGKPKDH